MPGLALLLALVVLAAAAPQSSDPWAPPDAVVREYVAAFNSGDSRMRQFLERHADLAVPLDTRVSRYAELKRELGTISLRGLRVMRGGEVEATVTTAQGEPATLTFLLSSASPRKLRGITVEIGTPGADPEPAPSPRDEATALRDVQVLVGRAVAVDEYSGAALVARDGRVRWQGAWGEADKERHVPNTIDTQFNIGSINKSFTAVAVAQLVAAGRLSPTGTVGRYLPTYPNASVRDRVTVQQLLDMQSGIGDFFGPQYERTAKASLRTLTDYLPLFADQPLLFEPGQGRQYSNGGFIVLGLIVEAVSGMPYDEYVRAHVFRPAGMQATGFPPASMPAPTRAVGYTMRLGPPRRDNRTTLPERGSSAGGAYSTAPDLLRYATALAGGTLVAPEAMRTIGRRVRGIGIAGGAPGLNATLDDDVNGYTVIVMSNYDPPSAERVARGIRGVLSAVRR